MKSLNQQFCSVFSGQWSLAYRYWILDPRFWINIDRTSRTAKKRFALCALRLAVSMILLTFATCQLQSQNTHVISHLDDKLPAHGNIIYCSSFEAAWQELAENILKEEVKLQEPISLAGNLNHSIKTAAYTPNYISDAYITEGGDSIICSSYFQEQLEWPVEFQSFGHPMRFYTGDEFTRCEYFGINLPEQENLLKYNPQVRVVEFENEDKFIVRLSARCRMPDTGYPISAERKAQNAEINGQQSEFGKKEICIKFKATKTEYGWVEIIIAKVPREKTLLKSVKKVEERINNSTYSYRELIPDDILAIPKIKLQTSHSYDELLGKHLANKGYEEYFFAMASQNINFEMDNLGARAGSDAKIVLKKGPSERRMVIDGPFLIYLKEYGAEQPYLAMWIDDPQWLVVSD